MSKAKQSNLFGEEESEWRGMPEFVQEESKPFYQVIVRFETEKDMQDFARLMGQKLTKRTKSLWHPFKSHWGNGLKKKYQNEP